MKSIIKFLLLTGCCLLALQSKAQSQSDMRLNEVLSVNENGFQDDYGYRHGWIELFNKSYGTVNIAGCYLSDDKDNLKKYMVPKGDVLTKIKPRQHILFWTDEQPFRGTYHINFALNENGGTVYFTSSDGRTLIDVVTYPALAVNASYGRIVDGIGEASHAWMVFSEPETGNVMGPTPSTNNQMLDSSKAQRFLEFDRTGIIMALTAMSVVFLALIFLYFIFKRIGKFSVNAAAKKAAAASGTQVSASQISQTSGEVYVAIATAIELYRMAEEIHDTEHTILTIDKVARTYSPWNSKLYGLREVPTKKQ